LAIGTELSALPAGCTQRLVGSTTHFQCGGAWLSAFMQGSNVSYVVVSPPWRRSSPGRRFAEYG
jgi:hypothetical protein